MAAKGDVRRGASAAWVWTWFFGSGLCSLLAASSVCLIVIAFTLHDPTKLIWAGCELVITLMALSGITILCAKKAARPCDP